MNVIFVGLSGIPYKKRACDTRLLSFAEAFAAKGNNITILNRYPVSFKSERVVDQELSSNICVIELFEREKPLRLFSILLLTFLSYAKEFVWLIRQNNKECVDIIHLYSGHYFEFFHYYIISKIIRAKIVYQYVEVRSSQNRNGMYHKINGFLCDRFGYKFFDGVISISTYIDNMVKTLSPVLPTIKVPPICNIGYYDVFKPLSIKEPYIMFCGSSDYLEVINLIIDSYRLSEISKKHKLILVLSGSEKSKNQVKTYANGDAEIKSALQYKDLITLYLGASALLIPLRNTIQDVARVPNKICEYTACKGLIITTNNGEIPYFFKDEKNALIAKDFSVEEISKKLNLVLKMNNQEIFQMKEEAYQVCKSFFDISVYSDSLDKFLREL